MTSSTALTTTTEYASAEIDELTAWLEHEIGAGATRALLRHQTEQGGPQVVAEFALRDVDGGTRSVADAILRSAHEDGRHFRGRSRYAVTVHRDREYLARRLLTIDGDEEGAGARSDEARLADVTSQLMRHTEASARLAIAQTLQIVDHYKKLHADAQKRIQELEAKYFKVVDLYERLTSMAHEREMEKMRVDREDKRNDALMETFKGLAPIVLKKLIPGLPQGAMGEEVLRQFLGSISEEQMEGLLKVLKPEQVIAVTDLYQAYGKRELDKKAKTNGVNGTSNGAASKQGGSL